MTSGRDDCWICKVEYRGKIRNKRMNDSHGEVAGRSKSNRAR